MYKKVIATSAVLLAAQGAVYIAEGSAAFDQKVTNNQTTVSPGVQYIQENYQ